MLKVLPIQTKTEQELACSRIGIPYRKELLAYAATVDEELVGVCQFRLGEDGGEIFDLAQMPGVDDFEAMFIMGRATLNFIDLCGVHYAFCRSTQIDEVLLRAIGFSKNSDGIYDVDLTHFFDHPCQHNK